MLAILLGVVGRVVEREARSGDEGGGAAGEVLVPAKTCMPPLPSTASWRLLLGAIGPENTVVPATKRVN